MAHLGTTEAAQIAGVSKNTIIRAIRSGKLSATRDETSAYQIDPAELARLYPDAMARHVASQNGQMAHDGAATSTDGTQAATQEPPSHGTPNQPEPANHGSPSDYRTKAIAWARIAKAEREKSASLESTVDDLRDRLDRSETARERQAAQIVGLIEHQQEKQPEPAEQGRAGWWFSAAAMAVILSGAALVWQDEIKMIWQNSTAAAVESQPQEFG